MLRMDEFNKIRKEFHINKKSVYQIAREYNRSWETVNKIIKIPEHLIELRGKRNRLPKVITPDIQKKINEYIEFEYVHKVPKKQRFTASVIFKKLQEELSYQGSARSIRSITAQIRKEFKFTKEKSFLNLDFEKGKFLQIDHGEVDLLIGQHQVRGFLFVASVPGFSLRYCQFFQTKSFEAWGEFHERVFNYFGGVFENIIYDNDSVLKINQTNSETQFSIELQIHYSFKAIYCNKASGHEKGAVENAVGYCRRNFLAGLTSFNSTKDVNHFLQKKSEDHLQGIHYVSKKILKNYYDEIKLLLSPLNPGKKWGRWIDLQVNSFQQISYQDHAYSVPERYVGSKIKAHITVDVIEIYDHNKLIATHSRMFLPEEDSLLLDHYLDQLIKKPMAINYAKVMKEQKFTTLITSFWNKLKIKLGEKKGNSEFIQTLLLKRIASTTDFDTAIGLALSYQAISVDAVKSILKQLQLDQTRSLEIEPVLLNEEQFNINKYYDLQEVRID